MASQSPIWYIKNPVGPSTERVNCHPIPSIAPLSRGNHFPAKDNNPESPLSAQVAPLGQPICAGGPYNCPKYWCSQSKQARCQPKPADPFKSAFDIPRILSSVGIGITGPLIGVVIAMRAGSMDSG